MSEVIFPPNRRLPWHSHPRGCVGVVVDGAVDKRFARFQADARAGALITMPPEEPHEDRFGRDGAAIVVVESQVQEDKSLACRTLRPRSWQCVSAASSPDRIPSLRSRSRDLRLS
ncbi:MAG: hypothetical protein E6G33_16200 [Actinobacteria bacterium]|nr:MAG: hypothetical protein E6G33_16200 [Actinomycetota bacterium]